ncbi:hypothetical protein CGZ95_13435 [Enemella evansiae]|uniref:extracellular solute-binding protein n=1 Tax=Enemella evansiae TaxID=2016499 RepID=UPI000B95F8B9|nr:extracellular solute-binding protein [Enemella evansiae]OYN98195.1 hypothetical protein CGZ95_13435 [Enemella evansiae]
MRRRTFLALAGGTAAATLSGCAASDSGALRFEGWDFEPQLVEQNLARFMQRNPQIRVEYTPITSAQFIQKITAEFMGGSGPDAMYMYDDYLASAVEAEWLQPIDGLPGVDRIYEAIYPVNAQAMSYAGRRWGVPYYTDSTCLTYNRRMLDQAGIKAPPRSLEELEAQCLTIRDRTGMRSPVGISAQLQDTAWSWWWSLVYANEADIFTPELAPAVAAPSSPLPGILEWLQQASRNEVVDPAAVQTGAIPLDNAMMAGQYAFMFGARYSLRKYNDPKKSKEAGNLAAALIPGLNPDTRGTAGSTRMYVIKADTELRDQAMTLLNYLGGFGDEDYPYTAKFWFDQQGLGYPFRELAGDPQIQADLAKWIDPVVYAELADVARPRSITAVPWYAEFEAALQRRTQEVLIGQLSPADACRQLDETAQTLVQRYA